MNDVEESLTNVWPLLCEGELSMLLGCVADSEIGLTCCGGVPLVTVVVRC